MEVTVQEMLDIKRKVNAFFKKYSDKYSDHAKQTFLDNYTHYLKRGDANDLIEQILVEIGVFPEYHTVHHEHLSRLERNYDISGNVLDVASGRIPVFGNIIAQKQLAMGKGTITLYDPLLVYDKPKFPNMVLHKEEFTADTDISKYDLVTSIWPCEATIPLLEAVCKARKSFYIALCGCPPDDLDYMSGYYYTSYVIDYAQELVKKYANGELIVETPKSDKFINPPILYNKK